MSEIKELAKSFDPKTIESKWYEFWEGKGYYAAGLDQSKTRQLLHLAAAA